MANKIAVAVIHGMGSQGKDSQGIDEISFSSSLYYNLQQELGHDFFHRVAWREVFWADILQDRQEQFVKDSLEPVGARWMKLRRFVMHNLGDAASYRKTNDGKDQIYERIHQRIADTITRLQELTDENTPLLILAHSLGGHIMSNYMYDMGKGTPHLENTTDPSQPNFVDTQSLSDFQRLKTLAGFTTFGCNIPVFAFSYEPQHISPINYPGTNIPTAKQLAPWWNNYNDKDDVLGMPLANLSPDYTAMANRNELQDHWVRARGLLASWTPLSHSNYWTSPQFYEPVAQTMRSVMDIGPVS